MDDSVNMVGEDKVGQIECAVCGEFFWYNTTGHQKQHSAGQPQDYYAYKEYVREKFNLEENDELLDDDTVINPNKWDDKREEYPDVEIDLKQK